jgi:hypothetical protein
MASNRFSLFFVAVTVSSASVFVACVGNDPTQTSTSANQDAATNGGDAGPTDAQVVTDTGPATDAGSAACVAYCSEFEATCGFSTASDQQYADTTQCMAICATMPESGLTTDSVACRARYLPDAGDCPAGGPWATDNDTSTTCGSNEPCTAICAAVTPACAAVGAGGADCLSFCGNLGVADVSEFTTCMETNALLIYQTGSSKSDIAAHCGDFQACN